MKWECIFSPLAREKTQPLKLLPPLGRGETKDDGPLLGRNNTPKGATLQRMHVAVFLFCFSLKSLLDMFSAFVLVLVVFGVSLVGGFGGPPAGGHLLGPPGGKLSSIDSMCFGNL